MDRDRSLGRSTATTSRHRERPHRRKLERKNDDDDDNNSDSEEHLHGRATRNIHHNHEDYLPLGYVPQIDDILCGKTKEAFNHDGNQMFRITIGNYVHSYAAIASRSGRGQFISQLLDKIRSQGGRFLKKRGDRWVVLNPKHAREKVGHALRDTAWQMGKSLMSPTASSASGPSSAANSKRSVETTKQTSASNPKESDLQPLPYQNFSGNELDCHLLPPPLPSELSDYFTNVNPRQDHHRYGEPSTPFVDNDKTFQPLITSSSLDYHHQPQQQQQQPPVSLVAALAPHPMMMGHHHHQPTLDDFNSRSSISTTSSSGSSEDVQIQQVAERDLRRNNENADFVIAATLQLDEVKKKLRRASKDYVIDGIDVELEPISISDTSYPPPKNTSGSYRELQHLPALPNASQEDDKDESDTSTIDHFEDAVENTPMEDFSNDMDW